MLAKPKISTISGKQANIVIGDKIPVESQTTTNGTINQYRVIRALDAATGIIYFREEIDCGGYWAQMRFTYTGGYFWETLEPADGNYPTTMPSTATALPADLQLAWFLQVAEVWKKKDKLGQGIATDDDKGGRINPANLEEQFLPEVKSILSQYIRYSFI